jgi:hypothetical protein
MSFHDPFNAFVYCSNQCDATPFKNLRNKLSHYVAVPHSIPIKVLLYSLKKYFGVFTLTSSKNWNNHVDSYFI